MERADSMAFDLHKWMYLSYPIGCVLIRDADEHRRTFSLTPTYLAHGEGERGLTGIDVPWLSDYGFELSRGFHALKAWMTIKEQGTEKYGRLIQQNIDQAHYLARLVERSPELERLIAVFCGFHAPAAGSNNFSVSLCALLAPLRLKCR
jgi:glutamate/tyrosine decarboxylase-like PLP-dependent enzyme